MLRIQSFFLVACISMFAACSGTSLDGFDWGNLFEDVTSSKVKVVNNTGVDVVLFRNTVSDANKLGGIKSGDKWPFGIKEISGLQIIKVVSASDYEKNYGDLGKARVIDSFIAYVSSSGTITNFIADRTQGETLTGVSVYNSTTQYAEVFTAYWGNTFVTVVAPGDTVKQYMPSSASVSLYASQVLPVTGAGDTVRYLQRKNLVQNIVQLQPSSSFPTYTIVATEDTSAKKYAYIHVKNELSVGIYFKEQSTHWPSTLKRYIINPNEVEVYEVKPPLGSMTAVALYNLAVGDGYSDIVVGDMVVTNGTDRYIRIKTDRTFEIDKSVF